MSQPLEKKPDPVLEFKKYGAMLATDPSTRPIKAKISALYLHCEPVSDRLCKLVLRLSYVLLALSFIACLTLCLLDSDLADDGFWWELVGIVSMAVITLSVYAVELVVLYRILENQRKGGEIPAALPGFFVAVLSALILFALVLSAIGAVFLYFSHRDNLPIYYSIYLLAIFLVTLLFCAIDYVTAKHSFNHTETDEATSSLIYASLPVCISFLMLLVYALAAGVPTKASGRMFLAGAAAFQMIMSNVVFVFIKARVFEKLLYKYSEQTYIPRASIADFPR